MNTNKTTITAEAGKQELFIIREFDAPRELVFRAFTEPELMKKWLGPKNMEMRIDHMDNRSGGAYRYVNIDENGNEYAFNGVTHESTAPERIIHTFEFEGLRERGHVSMEIATFEELPNDRTKLTVQSIFRSVADRDGMVSSGMEKGVVDSYNSLDDLLANKNL